MSPRSYYAGKRATKTEPSSRVRVYEREGLDGIFMTRAWVKTPSGRPKEEKLPEGVTWEAAEALADLTASERRHAILEGRTATGQKKRVTLEQLWEKYLESAKADDWSPKHAADMERSKEFWLSSLDPSVPVETLVTADVEKAARDARKRRDLSRRWEEKRLKHLRSAVLWGLDKARLYDRDPLRGLEYPDYEPDTEELIYTPEEIAKLSTPHEDVDWRVTLACSIAADTGRRISAILALTVHDVLTDGERVFLRFRKEWDKSGKEGLVPISKKTAALLADALELPDVEETEFLFPEGRWDQDVGRHQPATKRTLTKKLHDEAEEAWEIPYVEGRAFHGIKRRHVTVSAEVAHGDLDLVGDLTGNVDAELLRRVYRWKDTGRMVEHVDRIRARIEGEEEPSEGPQETREDTRESEDE